MWKDELYYSSGIIEYINQKGYYLFKGVSVFDIYFFLETKEKEIIIFKDIPYKDSDNCGSTTKYKDLKPTDQKKIKDIYKKDINKAGTDIIIGKNKNSDSCLLEFSQKDIRLNLKQKPQAMQGIYAYFDVHDFDDESICYFENDEVLCDFLEYLKRETKKKIIHKKEE